MDISRDLLALAVDQSDDGITISGAGDWPLLYVNAGFERLTGYRADELLGKSLRFLQGNDTDQSEISEMREALHQGRSCRVTLRNYRRDGSMFWNELSLSPVRNEAGELTHYIGIQKDVTERVLHNQRLHQSNLDLQMQNQKLTAHNVAGLCNRHQFEGKFEQMLQGALRTHSLLSVLILDLDQFKLFNERYGRQAGDACLRMVGERIAKSFGRSVDCVTRYEGDEFAVVSTADSIEGLKLHLQRLRDQIRALNIPHHDSQVGVVTICAGCVSLVPQKDASAAGLLEKAREALIEAKRCGYDCEHLI